MKFSIKSGRISSAVAAICITVYVGAIVFGAVQIAIKTGERRALAEREFNDLVDRAASSSVFLGFLSDSYNTIIRDFLFNSETLTGIIIIASGEEYAVERETGRTIIWDGSAPRFRTGVPLSGGPFSLPIRVEGYRNVTVQAVFTYYDYYFYQSVLRNVLFAVLLALIIALTTLMLELLSRTRPVLSKPLTAPSKSAISQDDDDLFNTDDTNAFDVSDGFDGFDGFDDFSVDDSRDNVGSESFTFEKLKEELNLSIVGDEDLVFLAAEFKYPHLLNNSHFSIFNDEAIQFLSKKEMIFQKGETGISVIIPNIDLEEGLIKSEEFRKRIIHKLAPEPELNIGLSSRAGRPVDAERLMMEAYAALERAHSDNGANIIAFKSDPEKFKKFMDNYSNDSVQDDNFPDDEFSDIDLPSDDFPDIDFSDDDLPDEDLL
ncbi:MAG: hypothetical protein FWG77_12585 [Treponema sp.]|nr:hypothetical protein [Treponema sp.]